MNSSVADARKVGQAEPPMASVTGCVRSAGGPPQRAGSTPKTLHRTVVFTGCAGRFRSRGRRRARTSTGWWTTPPFEELEAGTNDRLCRWDRRSFGLCSGNAYTESRPSRDGRIASSSWYPYLTRSGKRHERDRDPRLLRHPTPPLVILSHRHHAVDVARRIAGHRVIATCSGTR